MRVSFSVTGMSATTAPSSPTTTTSTLVPVATSAKYDGRFMPT